MTLIWALQLIDSAFNDTLWNIATGGDLTTVQDAEKDLEERLASYNAAQNIWAAWQSWIVTGGSYNWIKNNTAPQGQRMNAYARRGCTSRKWMLAKTDEIG